MRDMLRFGFAAALGLVIGGAGLAQTTGGTGGTTSGRTGATGGATGGATPQTFLDTSALDSGVGAMNASSSLNTSNAFSRYYANPLYQGRAGAAASENPGGFGSATYTTTGGAGGRVGTTGGGLTGLGGSTGGRTSTGGFGTAGLGTSTGLGGGTTGFGGTTGLGGRTGGGSFGATGFGGQTGFGGGGLGATGFGGQTGFGGRTGGFGTTGAGGRGGFGGTQQNAAQVIQQPRPIAYTSQLRFTPPPMTASRMQNEVRAVLDRSTVITNARGITVETDGAVVVLKGTVRDEDEARLVEGMIRLTPGVRDVKNELRPAGSTQIP